MFEAQHRMRIWQNYCDTLRAARNFDALRQTIMEKVEEAYNAHEAEQGEENMRLLERLVTLRIIDTKLDQSPRCHGFPQGRDRPARLRPG